MAALCKAPTKSAGIGLSITAVCKNAKKKTLGQEDFFVVTLNVILIVDQDTILHEIIEETLEENTELD